MRWKWYLIMYCIFWNYGCNLVCISVVGGLWIIIGFSGCIPICWIARWCGSQTAGISSWFWPLPSLVVSCFLLGAMLSCSGWLLKIWCLAFLELDCLGWTGGFGGLGLPWKVDFLDLLLLDFFLLDPAVEPRMDLLGCNVIYLMVDVFSVPPLAILYFVDLWTPPLLAWGFNLVPWCIFFVGPLCVFVDLDFSLVVSEFLVIGFHGLAWPPSWLKPGLMLPAWSFGLLPDLSCGILSLPWTALDGFGLMLVVILWVGLFPSCGLCLLPGWWALLFCFFLCFCLPLLCSLWLDCSGDAVSHSCPFCWVITIGPLSGL